MKKKKETNPVAEPEPVSDAKFLGPCVVASLVWLVLSVYILWVVPKQLDVREQLLKPEQLREALPTPLRMALYVHEIYGATIVSALGFMGCGAAYIFRSTRLANWMIGAGALCLAGLVWAVLASLPH